MNEILGTVPRALVAAWVVAFGAVVGSFLNVVVARLPRGVSVVRPRSRCPACGAAIAWYDNVPVVSWLLLRARCRACGARISARYPLVEALGAAAAWLAWHRHGLGAGAAAELLFVALLVALALVDLDTWLLPHALTWPLLGAGLLLGLAGLTPAGSAWSGLAGAGVGFAAFALVAAVGERVFRREALGFGDVWLLSALGAWLGAPALLPVVLLASLQGSAVGIALVLLGRSQPGPGARAETSAETPPAPAAPPDALSPSPAPDTPPTPAPEEWVPPRHAVPFGPFLVAGALEWLYLGGALAEAVPVFRVFR